MNKLATEKKFTSKERQQLFSEEEKELLQKIKKEFKPKPKSRFDEWMAFQSKTGLRQRIIMAIRDRHVGEREQIPVLNGVSLDNLAEIARTSLSEQERRDARAKITAFLVQGRIREESVEREFDLDNQDKLPEELEYTHKLRQDLLEETNCFVEDWLKSNLSMKDFVRLNPPESF